MRLIRLSSVAMLLSVAPLSLLASPSLREQAEAETTHSKSIESSHPSDARVDGLLSLKDPGLTEDTSPWRWDVGLHAQSIRPRGEVSLPGGNLHRLDQTGAGLTPSVDLNGRRHVWTRGPWKVDVGGRAGFGYMSRKTEVVFENGFREPNARFSTGFATVGLLLGVRSDDFAGWEIETGYDRGLMSYAQGGNNDIVNFARQVQFEGWNAGLVRWIDPSWGLNIEYSRRARLRASDVDIQTHNMNFGARILW